MPISSTESWLSGEGDLAESTVEDVPVKGESVKIRALSATVANGANSSAVTTTEVRGKQEMRVDGVKLDIIKFCHGVVEPKFNMEQATLVSGKYGPAFNKVVTAINDLSGISEESIKETEARFPDLGEGASERNGTEPAGGSGGPDKPARAGARAGNDG